MTVARLASDDPRAAWPIFTVEEAARYLGIAGTTLASWIEPERGESLVSAFARQGRKPRLSFVNFAEAYVIHAARRAGLRMSTVRGGVARVKRDIGVDYALATKRLLLSKTDLLVGPEGGTDLDSPGDLERAHDRQMQMAEFIKNELRHIDYGTDGIAQTIELPAFRRAGVTVTVDPYVAFGAPIIPRTGARVRDIISLHRAGESHDRIAYDFSLSRAEVDRVIRASTKPSAPARSA